MTRILVVDEQPDVRKALRGLLAVEDVDMTMPTLSIRRNLIATLAQELSIELPRSRVFMVRLEPGLRGSKHRHHPFSASPRTLPRMSVPVNPLRPSERLRLTLANQKPGPRSGSGTRTRSSIAVQK